MIHVRQKKLSKNLRNKRLTRFYFRYSIQEEPAKDKHFRFLTSGASDR
jgi:hypothetical protein